MVPIDDRLILARVTYRHWRQVFSVRQKDRLFHTHVVGKTGVGKSTLLRVLMEQDVAAGNGCALLDPHGELAEAVLEGVPERRRADVLYVDPADEDTDFTLNPLARVAAEQRPLAAASVVEVFKKLWPDDWGPRLEHLLRNVIWTLLEQEEATLGDIPRLLSDKDFRRAAVSRVENLAVRAFWKEEFEKYSPGFRSVVVAPLQNKVGAFLTDPRLRHILTAKKSSVDVREVMDSGRVLLVNLAKGPLGEQPAALLGSLLVSQMALAGLARADTAPERRRAFFVYLDEFHTFSTRFLPTMLSELRKYRVGLILANQYLGQLDPEVRDAVIGNVGTLISFRVGAKDAAFLAGEFAPVFQAEDLVNLPNYHIYLRLMIDGQVSKPFSATTLASVDKTTPGLRQAV